MNRNPNSQHAPAMATPRSISPHQPSTAPAHVVQSQTLIARRAAVNRRQV